MFRILRLCFVTALIILTGVVSAQTKAEKVAKIQKLLSSKNFTFIAESASPMSGGNIRLSPYDYQLSIYRDSLESFLPYFGTAYRAKYGSTESPLSFSSTNFTYEIINAKKGVQTIRIKINTPDDPDWLILSVSSLGYSTLQVNSINRQPISFYGVITSNKEKAK